METVMARKKLGDLIAERQLDLDLTNQDIASAIGYANQNIISMIKKGRTKLPLERVTRMADVLGLDRADLLRMALKEYSPELLKAIEDNLGAIVTKNEQALLEIWRDATDHKDPVIPEAAVLGLHQGFSGVMKDQMALKR